MEFVSTILYIVLAVVILLLMVMIHELGHYIVGRWLNFKIDEFSIGFGKAIWQKKNKRGELISLRIFPLGGYCAFAGEEGEEEEKPKQKKSKSNKDSKKADDKEAVTLNQNVDNSMKTTIVVEDNNTAEKEENKEKTTAKTAENDILKDASIKKDEQTKKEGEFLLQAPWKRILVFLAGVTFNMISAIFFAFILLVSFGYDIQKIESVDTGNIQYVSVQTFEKGDVIWEVNGTKVNFAFTGTLPKLIDKCDKDEQIDFTIERNGKEMIISIMLTEKTVTDETTGEDIVTYHTNFSTTSYRHSFFEALARCFEVAFGFAWVVLIGFWQIISGQIGISQLGGPITTISTIGAVSAMGAVNVFILLPLIAANLAIFNLIPFPALDGSHVLFTTLEWIFKKPVPSRKIQGYIHGYGMIVLFAFVIVIDIIHIIFVGL